MEIWQNRRPDLIRMDISMPVMDGYEATRRIRELERASCNVQSATLIIAQTASSFEEERSIVLDAGCDDFLRKPFKDSEIFELMHKHLGICFVYETAETEEKRLSEYGSAENEITQADFATIPDDLLQKLKHSAIDSDMDRVNKIRGINMAIGAKLAYLAEDFEYGKITRMIGKTNELQNG